MLFSQDRDKSREMFINSWNKHLAGKPLEPLEKQIAAVVEEHPEYHSLLQTPENTLDKDFSPDHGQVNPFLHMGMHLALREQVGTDRPRGIAMITRSLLMKYGDGHAVEHQMMECLGEMLWSAQRNNTQPDEAHYLESLRQL